MSTDPAHLFGFREDKKVSKNELLCLLPYLTNAPDCVILKVEYIGGQRHTKEHPADDTYHALI